MLKKLSIASFVLFSFQAFALPVGNPADSTFLQEGFLLKGHHADPNSAYLSTFDAIAVRVGFYGDYVFQRHLKSDRNPFVPEDNPNKLDHAKIFTNAALVTLNFWDRFDIFGTLGTTSLFFEGNPSSFGSSLNGIASFETDSALSWSIGFRGTIWECGRTSFGIVGQYFGACPDIQRITVFDRFSSYPDRETKYREWQIAIGLSERFGCFIPYVAAKWAHARLSTKDPFLPIPQIGILTFDFFLPEYRNDKHWGWAAGFSIVDISIVEITCEARFGDEKALYLSGQTRF